MSERMKLIIIGCLYLAAFGLYGGGQYLFSEGAILYGFILVAINSAAVLTIGLLFRPIIAKSSAFTANAYMFGRLADSLCLLIGGYFMWHLAGSEKGGELNLLGYHVGMIIFGITGVIFCMWLLKYKRVPTLLAWLGIVGYFFMPLAMIADHFNQSDLVMILLPAGALFEIVFAFWLIFKGLNPSGTKTHDAPARSNRGKRLRKGYP